jgi:GAF domain-containing protein
MRGHVSTNRDGVRDHALLEAIAIAAERLLEGTDPPPVPEVLETLGIAAGVSRLALVAARPGGASSAPRMESRQQWAAPGIARLHPGPDGWARYPARWRDALAAGTMLAGPTRTFPAEERTVLEAAGARSAALVPVMSSGTWYGHLAAHDAAAERTWSPGELEALRAAAVIIGSAINQRRLLAEAERRSGLLRAVGTATSLLAEAGNWRTALPRVLDGLRAATRTRGAWAYAPDPDAPSRAVLLYEVLAPGARSGGGRARTLEIGAEAASILEVTGVAHDGMDPAQAAAVAAAIAAHAGTAWAIAPMVLDADGIGAVGLDGDSTRAWADGELEALEIVASALKAAMRRGGGVTPVPIVANPWGQVAAVTTPVPVEGADSGAAPASAVHPPTVRAPRPRTGNRG